MLVLLVSWQTAQDWLNRGVQAFRNAHYAEAVTAFRTAVSLKPADITARLYLATALQSQYIPGAEAPENLEFAANAEAELRTVLQLDPNHRGALLQLASLAYNQRKLDDARGWYERLVDLEPAHKEAHYSLGVIAWSKWYPAFQETRTQLGMKPEDAGPLKDAAARADLSARFGAVIEAGIAHLEKALAIDPDYDDAMAYLNLLLRERADLAATPEEYRHDIAAADQWLQKALETKKKKAAAFAAPDRIRVGDGVQSAKLIRKIDPPCPPGAAAGTVRLRATIDPQGAVAEVEPIGGPPALVAAATEAVRQWLYQPTLLNGQPVSVVTVVEVAVCPAR